MAESVRIGPLVVPVGENEDPDWDRDGEFKPRPTAHITIAGGLVGLARPMTILHECIEGISELNGLGLKEYQVRVLEVALTDLIRDNPQLVQDLQT